MKNIVIILFIIFLLTSMILPSVSGSSSSDTRQAISEITVSLISPYSANLNLSYYVFREEYSKFTFLSYYEKVNTYSYSSITIFNPFLPINISVTGLFGAEVSGYYLDFGSGRFNYSYEVGSKGFVNISSELVYNGSAVVVSVKTVGPHVGVMKSLNLTSYPEMFPSEVIYLHDLFNYTPNSVTSPSILSVPYGDVVSFNASCPLTSDFNYVVKGNVINSNTINMTGNSTVTVYPVFNGQYAFVSIVFIHLYLPVTFKGEFLYNNITWYNISASIESNTTENVATGSGSSGSQVSISPPTYSRVSIYLPSASSGAVASYEIYDFLNDSMWNHSPGYFNFTDNGGFEYMVIANIHLVNPPKNNIVGVVKFLIDFGGGVVGVLSLVIFILIGISFQIGGEAEAKQSFEKLRALVVMDFLFFIVFMTGLVFWLVGG
ncbi:MAG: hypothetical protein QXU98_06920 [Candidatus Parvarchaeota archaeon]